MAVDELRVHAHSSTTLLACQVIRVYIWRAHASRALVSQRAGKKPRNSKAIMRAAGVCESQ